MKAKNVLIILVLNYLLIVVFCSFSEFLVLNDKAKDIQLIVRTAADMAVEQVQATDDFFKPGEGYMLNAQGVGNSQFTMKVPNGGSNYINVNAFEAITGKHTKKDIFGAVYGGLMQNFIANNPNVLDIETTVGFWNDQKTGVAYYKIPRIAQMGLDVTGYAAKKVYFNNNLIEGKNALEIQEGIWHNYGLNKAEKVATLNGVPETYFMSPLSIGITYINEELLQYYFMNNLDLLMRSKYSKSGIALNTKKGGMGVLKGESFPQLVADDLDLSNPINNGVFTLLRGAEVKDANTGAAFYKGVAPVVRYKVIDMYDSANDELLSYLFGATPTLNGSKAEYFRNLNSYVIDPTTGAPYTSKPIVVADVTFYADIIVPYTTVALREMRGKETPAGELSTMYLSMGAGSAQDGNYIDLVRIGSKGSGKKGGLGNPSDCVIYTRLFAVAP